MLIGEWTCTSLPPDVRSVVIYKADGTYFAQIDDPNKGAFSGAGTWRIKGTRMICEDSEGRENTAEILKISDSDLEIRGSDGVVSRYKRIR